jgi:hypothetical protein
LRDRFGKALSLEKAGFEPGLSRIGRRKAGSEFFRLEFTVERDLSFPGRRRDYLCR